MDFVAEFNDNCIPTAVVLGLSPTGLFVVRSLGRRNVHVIGVDNNALCVGRFSKYLDTFMLENNAGLVCKRLIDIASGEECKPILFCTSDYYLQFLAEYSDVLREYYVMPKSYVRETINLFLNKAKFYKICIENSIDLPTTYFPSSLDDVKRVSKHIRYPCIIKPTLPHLWRRRLKGKKIIFVESPQKLVSYYKFLSPREGEVIIQEVVPGGEELIYVFGGYFNRYSEPLAVFTGRKLRQFPPMFGSASLMESVENQEILEKSVSILKKMGYHGICGTEFKLDPRSGVFKMMEINIRPTLWFSVTMASGVDIIYTAYKDLAELPTEGKLRQEKYAKWIYFARDFVSSIYYVTRGKLKVKEWMASLRKINAHAIYARDDLYPAIFYPISLFKEFFDYFLTGG